MAVAPSRKGSQRQYYFLLRDVLGIEDLVTHDSDGLGVAIESILCSINTYPESYQDKHTGGGVVLFLLGRREYPSGTDTCLVGVLSSHLEFVDGKGLWTIQPRILQTIRSLCSDGGGDS